MHTKKKVIAWVYYWFLRKPLLAMVKWPDQIEEFLGYCCNGCENCYAWRCSDCIFRQTPYRKFRRKHKKN